MYFRLFNTVENKQMFNKIYADDWVEPRTSGIESDRSTNWATTTSQRCVIFDVHNELASKGYTNCVKKLRKKQVLKSDIHLRLK